MPKTYLRPISSAVISQSQSLAAQNTTPVAFLPQVRSFQTSPVTRDIDSAAKFIGAGAATVGVAGSGKCSAMNGGGQHICTRKQWTIRYIICPVYGTERTVTRTHFVIMGLWKSCTWGTQTSTWLLFAYASGRSENRAVLRVFEELHNIPAGCLWKRRGRGDKKFLLAFTGRHWYLPSPAIWVQCAGWILHPELNSD